MIFKGLVCVGTLHVLPPLTYTTTLKKWEELSPVEMIFQTKRL